MEEIKRISRLVAMENERKADQRDLDLEISDREGGHCRFELAVARLSPSLSQSNTGQERRK